MKKALLNIVVLVFFLFCTIAVVDAQTAPEVVKKAFNVRPGGWLTLNSELGMIDVKATNRNRVDVVFTKSLKSGGNIIIGGLTSLEVNRLVREAFADFEATFEQKGSNVFITGKFKRGWEYWLRRSQHISLLLLTKVKIEFQVTVPRRYNVDLTAADSADIHVGNIGGEVIAKTDWGDIQLGSVAGSVNAKTDDSGSITLKGCQSKVDAITGWGDIQLSNVAGSVNAKTGDSGDIEISNAGSTVIAETGWGDIQLSSVSGSVNAKTDDSGSITLKGCQSKVDAITGWGDIRSELTRQVRHQWTLETLDSGEIVVALIPAIAIDIDTLSGSGRVSSDFPVRGSKSKNSLKGTINGGGPLLKLRTSSGDIRLLRKGR